MTIKDIIHETYSALSANKVRSGLTMLGIVIGISSVIAMVSIGQGAQGSIESSIQSIGSNLIIVMPGAQRGAGIQVSSGRGSAKTLTTADALAIESEVLGIKAVAPDVTGRYQITSKGKNTNTSVVGTTDSYPEVRNIQVDVGNFVSDQQNKSLAKVAVIGPTVAEDLFGIESATNDTTAGSEPTIDYSTLIGKTIRIQGSEYKIIGVTKAKGGSGFGSQDDMIFIPLATAQKFLVGDEYLSNISVAASESDGMALVQSDITNLLLDRHKISDPQAADFSTLNQADIVATASSVTATFTILLGAVAGISLVVGGIGIMNMMLTTVTERTREIGLRKAIGAKKKDINRQFLIEAIALTCAGGIVGVLLGWGVSFGISYFGILQTSVSWSSVFLAFFVSAIIGIVFGYYPARRAGGLNPIEALRYE